MMIIIIITTTTIIIIIIIIIIKIMKMNNGNSILDLNFHLKSPFLLKWFTFMLCIRVRYTTLE